MAIPRIVFATSSSLPMLLGKSFWGCGRPNLRLILPLQASYQLLVRRLKQHQDSEGRHTAASMRIRKLAVLALAAELVYGYLDTSPFFMFSTSE
jgi:hypothetical protein